MRSISTMDAELVFDDMARAANIIYIYYGCLVCTKGTARVGKDTKDGK